MELTDGANDAMQFQVFSQLVLDGLLNDQQVKVSALVGLAATPRT